MRAFSQSQKLLDRALKSIPLGTQTFSKSYKHYPVGVSPHFIERGNGAYVYDVDGNEYIDMVNALAAITLGYANPEINLAVTEQLNKGTIFSLPSELEIELAEMLIETIPSAEMVRFGKNASDSTSAAIRVARAYTGRDRIAVCGYHGWHDWYIGSTDKKLGVPESVSELTSTFKFNDLSSLERILSESPGQYAAVIMEAMNIEFPQPGFLSDVKALAHEHGALFILDETVTGFRLDIGGAQTLFNVTPDISCFGKGMANGFPISAIVGKKEVMSLFDEVFYSFTYGGELLSIVAAIKSIQILKRDSVLDRMQSNGNILISKIKDAISDNSLEEFVHVSGHPSWSFVNFTNLDESTLYKVKTLFLQECFKRGLITLGSNNMTYCHDENIVNQVGGIYHSVFSVIRNALDGDISSFLQCEVLKPLFKVRK